MPAQNPPKIPLPKGWPHVKSGVLHIISLAHFSQDPEERVHSPDPGSAATKRIQQRAVSFLDWYNEHRPHMTLEGSTPNEVYFGQGLRDENDPEVFESNLVSVGKEEPASDILAEALIGDRSDLFLSLRPGDALLGSDYSILPVPVRQMCLREPTTVVVEVEFGKEKWRLGKIALGFKSPPPLSPEERRAIASRPNAPGKIGMTMHCKKCEKSLTLWRMVPKLRRSVSRGVQIQ